MLPTRSRDARGDGGSGYSSAAMPSLPPLARPSLAPALVALVLLAGVGCGPPAEPEVDVLGGASLRRLPLWPVSGSPARATVERVERIVPPDDPARWEIAADSVVVGEADGRASLRLDGGADQSVEIPVDVGAREFNQVAVTLRATVKRDLSVMLGVPGNPRAVGAHSRHLDGTGELRTVIFDFDENLRARRRYDRVTVAMQGWKGPWELVSVDLLLRPRSAWLPGHDRPAPVPIGVDARQAVGLETERPLQTEFDVPAGAVLAFAAGVPAALRVPREGEGLVVRYALLDGSTPVQENTLVLDQPESGPAPWTAATVPLDRFAGRKLRATFRLEGPPEAVCALAVPHVFARGDEPPPVVLLVTSDTHRADHVGAAGGPVQTPALDALAAQGVLFRDCLTSTNVTNPSHIALMTATHPRDTGILDNYRQVGDGAPTLAERFRDAGFTTLAAVSAQHLSHAESGLGQGFDRLSAPQVPQRDSAETVADLLAWLPEFEGRPLFVWLHLFDAHTPYDPPQPFAGMYRQGAGGDPFAPGEPAPEGFPEPFLEATVGRPGLRDLSYPDTQYRAEVSYLDERLGTVLGHARFLDAVIAVTGDHGESLGEHGVYWDHAGLYPQTLGVPMILRWPGGPRGAVSDVPVRQIDAGRTLLDLVGLGRAEFPGRDLREALPGAAGEEEARARPRFALAAHGMSASITEGRWHLVLHLRRHYPQSTRVQDVKHLNDEHQVELYDLSKDPACENDLRRRVKVAKPLRAKLLAWLKARQELGWKGAALEDTARMQELAQLGYASPGGDEGPELFDFDCDCESCRLYR